MEEQTIDKKWEMLVLENDTTIARTMLDIYRAGKMDELGVAVKFNYKVAVGGARHTLWRHLYALMEQVLLAKFSEEHRTQKRWQKICRWRDAIKNDLAENACLDESSIKQKWKSAFEGGQELAVTYVKQAGKVKDLTWNEVFIENYSPANYVKKRKEFNFESSEKLNDAHYQMEVANGKAGAKLEKFY